MDGRPSDSDQEKSFVPAQTQQINKKTPLLVQPGQGDGEAHLGITHEARQRHIWCIDPEIADLVSLYTHSQ